MPRPLILIHGYAADGDAFDRWREILLGRGYRERDLHTLSYRSLSNDITLDDLAEGLERALRLRVGLEGDFDAIVHSTGMLVLRAWLTGAPERHRRLRHLIGLAPATFGSPLAHKGRGMLGALFRGNRQLGPDFLEAGDRILDALELGSAFTWELAELDMLGDTTYYGPTRTTPFAFILCGSRGYPFPLAIANTPGSDGTVRLAGCALNTRKIVLDLTEARGRRKRAWAAPWSNVDIPVIPIADADHATIVRDPSDELVALVLEALEVDSERTFDAWRAAAHTRSAPARNRLRRWQQLVFRVVDERGHPVPDYFVEFLTCREGERVWQPLQRAHPGFDAHVHVYGTDPSYRCFHLDLGSADLGNDKVGLRLLASSGTDLVGYHGHEQRLDVAPPHGGHEGWDEVWDGLIDLSDIRHDVTFFHPFTTTLVEVRLDREPLPRRGINRLVRFDETG
jgi:pimeloyl-ACP methyl ester carboxylesterase